MCSQLPKLILLPGMDGTGELFRDFANALPEEFKTVVVRYPTDNYFSYAQLSSFVESARPVSEPFVLVAESFSAPLAIQYAATKPSNLKALVICAGFVTSPLRGWRRFLCSRFAPLFFRVALPEIVAKHLLVGPCAPSSALAALRAAVSSVRPRVLSARVRVVLTCDARAELGQVAVPILYLQAKQDRLVGAWCSEEIRKMMPETTVMVIDGPHLLFQREPQLTADAIVKFIRRTV